MDIKRQMTVALLGAGLGLSGCQSAPFNGLAFWKKNDAANLAASTPDVGKQRFDGLSQQFAAGPRAAGQNQPGTAPLGGQKPAENDNFLVASWKKTTAAVTGAAQPKGEESSADPLRLDHPAKKTGPEVHVAAARLLENQGKVAEAQAQYQQALQANAKDLNALIGLARLHDRQGNARQALDLYQRAIKLHPTSSLAYNDLGLCYARQQQHDAALQSLSKAVELQPTNAKYRNNLATILVDLGQSDEALKHLTASSPPAVAHYNIGFLLQQKGQAAAAMQHYQQALALDPSLAAARDMISQLGGNQPAAPVATQTMPHPAASPFGSQTASEPAVPPMIRRMSHEESVESASDESDYGADEVASELPVAAPQIAVAPAAKEPAQFHIGDDAPVAEVSSLKLKWDSDWPLATDKSAAGAVYPLPTAQ